MDALLTHHRLPVPPLSFAAPEVASDSGGTGRSAEPAHRVGDVVGQFGGHRAGFDHGHPDIGEQFTPTPIPDEAPVTTATRSWSGQVDASQPRGDVVTRLSDLLAPHREPVADGRAGAGFGVLVGCAAHPAHGVGDQGKDGLAGEVEALGEGAHDHGWADVPQIAALGPISLTNVDQAGHRIGANAARLLLERRADRTRPATQSTLAPTLVPRRTTVRPGRT